MNGLLDQTQRRLYEARYLHDPYFHHLADTVAALLRDGALDETSVSAAVDIGIEIERQRKYREWLDDIANRNAGGREEPS